MLPHHILLALLVAVVAALPAPASPERNIQRRSFKVERVPNPSFVKHNGTASFIKAYNKWGIPLPDGLGGSPGQGNDLDGFPGPHHHHASPSSTTSLVAAASSTISPLAVASSTIVPIVPSFLTISPVVASSATSPPLEYSSTSSLVVAASSTSSLIEFPSLSSVLASSTSFAVFTSSTTSVVVAAAETTSSAGTINNSTADSGTVSATPLNGDTEFLAPITIGGQTINMDFDTGSSDLWVFNTQLPKIYQVGHTIYNPSESSTFATLEGATFSISYGDGSGAAGNVGTDEVDIGGATVTIQAIELPTAVSQTFATDTSSNGLVGLAFSKLNTVSPKQQKTFFENALNTLDEPVFTADLRHDAVGAYEFGAIDTSKFTGSLTYADINTTSGFWQFSSQSFAVDGGKNITVEGGQAIADTGTTLMLVYPAVVNAYYGKVEGAINDASIGGITFPCDSDLPDLSVDIGGTYTATIPGSLINFAAIDATNTSKLSRSTFE